MTALRSCLFLCGRSTQSRGQSRASSSSLKASAERLCRQLSSSARTFSSCGWEKTNCCYFQWQTVSVSFSAADGGPTFPRSWGENVDVSLAACL